MCIPLIQVSSDLQIKWSCVGKDEHIPLRQYMLMIALKALVHTSFGVDYFKDKDILQIEEAYDIVSFVEIMYFILYEQNTDTVTSWQ